jgi:hypothetical protein
MSQFAVNFKEIILSLIEQDQPARAKLHGLAADFRTNAATGPGDNYILGGEESLQFGRVEADRLAAEEIRQIGIADRRVRADALGGVRARFLRSRLGHSYTKLSSAKSIGGV